MEVPNRLSLALADELGNESICQKLNEWSNQVEYLCNPRPCQTAITAEKDSAAAAATAASSSPASTAVTTTTTDSPQSATSLVEEEEDPSSSSVVVLDFSTEEEELVVDDDSIVTNLSARLHYKMLESLTCTFTPPNNGDHHHHVDIPINKAMQEFATQQIAAWKNNNASASVASSASASSISLLLASILRASKNWIRWYLQIYSAKVKRRHIHIINNTNNNNNNANDDDDDDDPIHRFKSRIMLDFYMDLLHHLIIPRQQQEQEQQQHVEEAILARHVALLLFYATFDPIPPDNINNNNLEQQQQEEQQHVTFFQNILNLLIHVDSVPLALALMRNVHNAVTVTTAYHHSKKGSLLAMDRARVVNVKTTATTNNAIVPVCCPWAAPLVPFNQKQDNGGNNDGQENGHENEQESTFTYLILFCNMIAFCLRNQVPTPFPGSSSSSNHHCSAAAAAVAAAAGGVVGDERAELVCEILRTLYASRIGQEQLVGAASRDALDQLDQEQEQQPPHLHRLILDLLQLDDDDDHNNFDNDQKHRITECQLDTVSLLMDCGPGLMDYILASQQAVDALLSLLDRQVKCVLEQCSTTLKRTKNSADGGDASAMLTPILVVVHRFCQSSPNFRRQTFLSIFPASAESNYQRLVEAQEQQQQQQKGENQGSSCTPGRGGRTGGILDKNKKHNKMNMSPLDAPVGTKRWRMIQLLTCVPQSSHVKRFTGELLWLLCNENAQDFTHRVGVGNALPILSVKGFAQLPAHTFS